MTGSQLNPLHT